MFIDTTINVDSAIFNKIDEVALAFNISKSMLFALLIKEMVNNTPVDFVSFRRVRYQKRSKSGSWRCLHVSMSRDLYELALDLRKLCKFSVSFIFTYAVSQFLQTVIEKLMNDTNTDNNHSHYSCIVNKREKVYSYSVYYTLQEKEDPADTFEEK